MKYTTVEVDLDHGRVRPRGPGTLPVKALALLTVLEPGIDTSAPATASHDAGLRRFLSTPDFALTAEQFRASMETDPFEQ